MKDLITEHKVYDGASNARPTRHVECKGVKFVALPFTSLHAENGATQVVVSGRYFSQAGYFFNAIVYDLSAGDGTRRSVGFKRFDNEQDAIVWAAEQALAVP